MLDEICPDPGSPCAEIWFDPGGPNPGHTAFGQIFYAEQKPSALKARSRPAAERFNHLSPCVRLRKQRPRWLIHLASEGSYGGEFGD
jgi:hypothetical protein